ncbi:MAG TPA: response regulator [Cyclobacteriaceae bacterium]|jgi:CheY-like chemotaxis protein|nr:response regulator [Cyclobacteriaceae bacterium]
MKNTKECLLIDDDPDDQEIFSMALQEIDRSIKCVLASDGIHALTLLKPPTFTPDFIFIDINMPRMNGFQCLVEIKKLDHLKNAQIIMYSTADQPKIVELSKELGANDFLVKQISLDLLIQELSALFLSKPAFIPLPP